MTEEF